jgi:hypothetical protein
MACSGITFIEDAGTAETAGTGGAVNAASPGSDIPFTCWHDLQKVEI